MAWQRTWSSLVMTSKACPERERSVEMKTPTRPELLYRELKAVQLCTHSYWFSTRRYSLLCMPFPARAKQPRRLCTAA